MNNTLLFFTDEYPCWNAETIALAGENPDALEALLKSGSLALLGGGYVLTQKGVTERDYAARASFIPAPCLKDDEYFSFHGGIAKAIWPANPLIKSFMSTFPEPGRAKLDEWYIFLAGLTLTRRSRRR